MSQRWRSRRTWVVSRVGWGWVGDGGKRGEGGEEGRNKRNETRSVEEDAITDSTRHERHGIITAIAITLDTKNDSTKHR